MNSLTNKNQNLKNLSSATITQETYFDFNERDASDELSIYDRDPCERPIVLSNPRKFDAPNGETYWFCDNYIFSCEDFFVIEFLKSHSIDNPTAKSIWGLLIKDDTVPATAEGVTGFNRWYQDYIAKLNSNK